MAVTIIAVTSIVCLAIGIMLGGLPMRNSRMTQSQHRLEQALGIVAVAIVVLLIMADQQVASWAAIIAMAVGVGVGKIPFINRVLLKTFPVFTPPSPPRRGSSRSRKGTRKRSR